MANEEQQNEITALSEVVISILSTQTNPSAPMPLAMVGQRLSSKLQRPLREILDSRKLSEVLNGSLGERLDWEGRGPSLSIRLKTGAPVQAIRYHPSFWAAFSKPPSDPTQHRLIRIKPPFGFSDVSVADASPDQIEIDLSSVPPSDLPKPERDERIKEAIATWCKVHNLPQTQFFSPREALTGLTTAPAIGSPGVQALKALIGAIPADERGRFSLPLDLIQRLISE